MTQPTLFPVETTAIRDLPGYPCAWSDDRKHRYTLWRVWGDVERDGFCQFIGLNPSTATETEDDPTIRRCVGYAKAWGYAALCMTNLFSFRATDPRDMKAESEPTNDANREWLLRISKDAGLTVAAWGVHGTHFGEDLRMMAMFKAHGHRLHCLKRVSGGRFPGHPLYLAKNLTPELFAV